MKTIAIVAGARPNFMKIAPIVRARRKLGGDLGFTIIHTGQHYDIFFEELGIPSFSAAPRVLASDGLHATSRRARWSASLLAGPSLRDDGVVDVDHDG